jgi:hypothetical protein
VPPDVVSACGGRSGCGARPRFISGLRRSRYGQRASTDRSFAYRHRDGRRASHAETQLDKGETSMLSNMTRSRVIQVWFAAVALVVVAGVAFGAAVTVGTGAMLFALSLIPPAIVLLLWPGVQPLTAAEVLYGGDRRA